MRRMRLRSLRPSATRPAWLLRVVLAAGLACSAARAAPVQFNLDIGVPDVVVDSEQPRACTITYLVTDVTTNDTYAVRMQVMPQQGAKPVAGRLPCPPSVPPRVPARALSACVARAANAKTCVFSDMGREFVQAPELLNTAENASRCTSDEADFIGVACWTSGGRDICNVGCGKTREDAQTAARERCEAKQQQSCPMAGALPVLAP